jgi:regulator of protease activity HflC (stomatin/prohibitin superfamily)
VAAVCYFRVVDPSAAVTAIEAFAPATSQIAQTTLRSVLGGADLDQLLAERDRLNEDLQKIVDKQTEPWDLKVSTVGSRTSRSPRPCSARWPGRQKPSKSGARRSSTPKASTRRR